MLRIVNPLLFGALVLLANACSEETIARPSIDFRLEQSSFYALKNCEPKRVIQGTLLSELGGNANAEVRILIEGLLADSLSINFHDPLEERLSEELRPFGPKVERSISTLMPSMGMKGH